MNTEELRKTIHKKQLKWGQFFNSTAQYSLDGIHLGLHWGIYLGNPALWISHNGQFVVVRYARPNFELTKQMRFIFEKGEIIDLLNASPTHDEAKRNFRNWTGFSAEDNIMVTADA